MIKKDGVEIVNRRSRNANIAKETIQICKEGTYETLEGDKVSIEKQVRKAIAETVYYPDPIAEEDFPRIEANIEVVNETTAESAQRLLASGKKNLVALNFANGWNQGGGFLNGAQAQEEDLCRCSSLYSCLMRKPMFYNTNILLDDRYCSDGIIYSPNVPFFRDKENKLIKDPFELSIITSPAPNLRNAENVDRELLNDLILNRMKKILLVAEKHEHTNIILGAWGCGAFCNDANDIAHMFKYALDDIPAFEHVTFAVYDSNPELTNFKAFKETFQGRSP